MAAPGATVAITGLGTSNTQVLAAGQRSAVTFHNPNASADVIVCQAQDTGGNNIAATIASPAGGFKINAGGERKFTGNVQTAWNAAASAGSSTLTIWIDT